MAIHINGHAGKCLVHIIRPGLFAYDKLFVKDLHGMLVIRMVEAAGCLMKTNGCLHGVGQGRDKLVCVCNPAFGAQQRAAQNKGFDMRGMRLVIRCRQRGTPRLPIQVKGIHIQGLPKLFQLRHKETDT